MRGVKIGERERELVIAARKSGLSYKKAGEAAGISESAARRIVNADNGERSNEEKERESEGKGEFTRKAWKMINESIDIIFMRLRAAKVDAGELIAVIEEAVKNKDLDDRATNKLIFLLEKQARELTIPSLRDLAGIIGTMYDRQALANGESTENVTMKPEDVQLAMALKEALSAKEE